MNQCIEDINLALAHRIGLLKMQESDQAEVFFVYEGSTYLIKTVRSNKKTKLVLEGEVRATGTRNVGKAGNPIIEYQFKITSLKHSISEQRYVTPKTMLSKSRFSTVLMGVVPFLYFRGNDKEFRAYISSECRRMSSETNE